MNVSQLTVVELFFLILLVWVLIDFWSDGLKTTLYGPVGLNKNFWFHGLVIAVALSVAFLFIALTAPDTVRSAALSA